MKKRILSLALALVMALALVPFATVAVFAAGTTPSFQVAHEMTAFDGSALLFSQKPVEILTGSKYYNEIAYVLPVGTKIAQKMDGELVVLTIAGESSFVNGGSYTEYAKEALEVELTPEMANDKLGVRLAGSKRGRGLMTVFVSGNVNTLAAAPSFDVKYFLLTSEDYDGITGHLLFSEAPVDTISNWPRAIEYGGYVFPVGTKIAYSENNVLMELKLSGATPYLNGIWDYKPLAGTAKELVLTENLGSDEKGLIITTSLIDTSAKSNHLWLRVMIEGTAAAGVSEEYQKVYKWNSDVYNSKNSDAATLAYYIQPSAKIQSDDEKIIALAESLTTGRGDKYNAARAICEWVSYNIWYDYDAYNHITPRTENSALSTLADKYAVCEGYTSLTIALLRASGIPAKPVGGLLLDEENPTSVQAFYDFSKRLDMNYLSEVAGRTSTHVWTEAYIDGKWIIIDTTADSANSYENGVFSAQGV
ncbi:MAG: transglutaminase-like domain-containing protein, partial [Oscillospiraceae bacterium]|nr:transglutaminase-like domain-containing protein [Oscillospiraceae bacterium]